MSTTTGVNSTSNNSNALSTGQAFNSGLGRDAFLNLLMTQLRYQDPTNPMENKDFITQLAQFSSLEQLEKVGNGFESMSQGESASSAIALIGKQIEYVDLNSEDGKMLSGKVDSVKFEDGVPYLMIGKNKVMLGQVATVK